MEDLTQGELSVENPNLQEYRRLLAQRQGGHFWDSDYYSNYYSTNQVRHQDLNPNLRSVNMAAPPPPTVSGASVNVMLAPQRGNKWKVVNKICGV